MSPQDAASALWRGVAGSDAPPLPTLAAPRDAPDLASSFELGLAAQATIGAAVQAAAALSPLRGGPAASDVRVGLRDALAAFWSERLLRVRGDAPALWDPIAGAYRCADGRTLRVHTNFAHHRDALLRLIGAQPTREGVAEALKSRSAEAVEDAAAPVGAVAFMMRSFGAWDAHPHGAALAAAAASGRAPVAIERIGDAPQPDGAPPASAARPLEGLRVLDLTRIIAGPVAGRSMAARGADVMRLTAPHLPFIPALVIDAGRGKRSASLDLRRAEARDRLAALAADADVFLEGYRPGALDAHGFGPDRLAATRRGPRGGVVYASLSAWGWDGPWAARRGFDSIVQTAAGFNQAEAEAAGQSAPRPLPAQAIDHAAGYLLAFGIAVALARRAASGGSWRVRVSLAGTAQWIRGLGRRPDGFAGPSYGPDDAAACVEPLESGFGPLEAVRDAALIDGERGRLDRPSMPLGAHPAAWSGRLAGG